MHRHMHGVEIHLGYRPLEGYMVLGDCKAAVDESYAMPIPPRTRHGWANISGVVHHVPFVFGSLEHAGWGVYFDVEPVPKELDDLRTVRRTDWQMGASIFLEREIDAMAQVNSHQRRIVIPAAAMDRNGSGGLELAVSRVTTSGCSLPLDSYRAVSVVRGRGQLSLGPTSRSIAPHDHFGVPRGMAATIKQLGDEPMVLLDALIRGAAEGFQSP